MLQCRVSPIAVATSNVDGWHRCATLSHTNPAGIYWVQYIAGHRSGILYTFWEHDASQRPPLAGMPHISLVLGSRCGVTTASMRRYCQLKFGLREA